MDTEQLAAWLAAYKYSWEAQDADAFVKLFTADCQYADRPYAEPVQGKDFHAFWTALAQRQRDNLIEFEVLEALPVNRGMAVWKAQYVIPSTGEQKEGAASSCCTFPATVGVRTSGNGTLARDRVPNNTVANSDSAGPRWNTKATLGSLRHSPFGTSSSGTASSRQRTEHTCRSSGFKPNRFAAYHSERAHGGTGLIILEATSTHPSGIGAPRYATAHTDECIPGYKMVFDAIHAAGVPAFVQLYHPGKDDIAGVHRTVRLRLPTRRQLCFARPTN